MPNLSSFDGLRNKTQSRLLAAVVIELPVRKSGVAFQFGAFALRTIPSDNAVRESLFDKITIDLITAELRGPALNLELSSRDLEGAGCLTARETPVRPSMRRVQESRPFVRRQKAHIFALRAEDRVPETDEPKREVHRP